MATTTENTKGRNMSAGLIWAMVAGALLIIGIAWSMRTRTPTAVDSMNTSDTTGTINNSGSPMNPTDRNNQ